MIDFVVDYWFVIRWFIAWLIDWLIILCHIRLFCDCVIVNATAMKPLQMAYFDAMMDLSTSGRYDDRDDFTVVTQTMFAEATLPVDVSNRPIRLHIAILCIYSRVYIRPYKANFINVCMYASM